MCGGVSRDCVWGVVMKKVNNKQFVQKKLINVMFSNIKHSSQLERAVCKGERCVCGGEENE